MASASWTPVTSHSVSERYVAKAIRAGRVAATCNQKERTDDSRSTRCRPGERPHEEAHVPTVLDDRAMRRHRDHRYHRVRDPGRGP
jgi:hypothetical protein